MVTQSKDNNHSSFVKYRELGLAKTWNRVTDWTAANLKD
jgi:hypothetical protein